MTAMTPTQVSQKSSAEAVATKPRGVAGAGVAVVYVAGGTDGAADAAGRAEMRVQAWRGPLGTKLRPP